jgi:hypothetical protein
MCRDPGSKRGPLDLQSNALPTELSRLCHLQDRQKILVIAFRESKTKRIRGGSTVILGGGGDLRDGDDQQEVWVITGNIA